MDAVVLLDTYRWHETYGDPNSRILEASKGDKITVSDAEWDRSQTMDPVGLAKPSSDAAKAAKAGDPPPGQAPPELTTPAGEPVDE